MRKQIYVFAFVALVFAIPLSVAASVTPGSTSSVMGMPVIQNFTSLTASTTYKYTEYSGTNATAVTFVTDSDGACSVTITPDHYGQNLYEVKLNAGGPYVHLFSIDNMDIIPYIVLLITISILFGLMKSFKV